MVEFWTSDRSGFTQSFKNGCRIGDGARNDFAYTLVRLVGHQRCTAIGDELVKIEHSRILSAYGVCPLCSDRSTAWRARGCSSSIRRQRRSRAYLTPWCATYSGLILASSMTRPHLACSLTMKAPVNSATLICRTSTPSNANRWRSRPNSGSPKSPCAAAPPPAPACRPALPGRSNWRPDSRSRRLRSWSEGPATRRCA